MIQPVERVVESVGLFEAKTRLSELVARAEAGAEVVITRHNRPVAKIVPIVEASPSTRPFDLAKRLAIVGRIDALREELRAKHGSLTTGEIVSWVREGREERDERFWRGAEGGAGRK